MACVVFLGLVQAILVYHIDHVPFTISTARFITMLAQPPCESFEIFPVKDRVGLTIARLAHSPFQGICNVLPAAKV